MAAPAPALSSIASSTSPLRILIVGASGSLGRVLITALLQHDNTRTALTLYTRNSKWLAAARRLWPADSAHRVQVIEGDVTDEAKLSEAMCSQHVVYAGLAGADLARLAECVVRAMKAAGVRRLLFVSSMGIYDEVPGQRYAAVLDPYRASAAVIDQSDLDWTLLRPSWFTDEAAGAGGPLQLTLKGEPFKGRGAISRKALAEYIAKLATADVPMMVRQSVGISQ